MQFDPVWDFFPLISFLGLRNIIYVRDPIDEKEELCAYVLYIVLTQ
jgi:hypothetical protein